MQHEVTDEEGERMAWTAFSFMVASAALVLSVLGLLYWVVRTLAHLLAGLFG